MQKFIIFLSVIALFGSLSVGLLGCNTMEGVGEDMQGAGEAIEEEASD
jgi:predicted small secreted protein